MAQETLKADQMLDREFLEIRCRLLDVAAALDRIDRSPDAPRATGDPRYARLKDAIASLATDEPDRARRLQMIFSDPYDAHWRPS